MNPLHIGGLFVLLFAYLVTAAAAFANQGSRDVETEFGVVSVIGTPSRVITLSEAALDTALALGVQPVGGVATRGSKTISDYLQDKVGSYSIVGTSREFNLEAILRLRPA